MHKYYTGCSNQIKLVMIFVYEFYVLFRTKLVNETCEVEHVINSAAINKSSSEWDINVVEHNKGAFCFSGLLEAENRSLAVRSLSLGYGLSALDRS